MPNPTSKDTKETKDVKDAKAAKVRVFALAKELNVESKVLLDYCKELGFADVTNQLGSLLPDQADALKERAKKGTKPGAGHGPSTPAPAPGAPPKNVIPNLAKPIPAIPKPLPKPAPKAVEPSAAAPVAPPAPAVVVEAPAPTPAPEPAPTPAVVAEAPAKPAAPEVPPAPAAVAAAPQPSAPPPAPPKNVIPALGGSGIRNLTRPANLNAPRPAAPAPSAPTPASPPAVVAEAPAKPTPAAPEVKPVAAEVKPAPAVTAPAPAAPTPAVTASAPAPAAPAAPKPVTPAAPTTPATVAAAPSQPQTPAKPAPTVQAPPQPPPGPPKNVIPNLGQSGRPSVLSRAPAPPPPKHIAPSRTAVGQAPPPSSQRPQSGATGAPGQRPPGPPGSGGAGGPGGPPRTGPGTGPNAPAGPNRAGGPNAPKPGTPGQSVKLTPEMIERLRAASARGQRLSINEVAKTPSGPAPGAPAKPGDPSKPGGPPRPGPAGPGGFAPRPGTVEDEEEEKKKAGVIGRDSRHKGRTGGGRTGGGGPRVDRGSVVLGPGGVEMVEQQWGSRRGPRAALMRKAMRKIEPIKKEGKIEIPLPITVRSLSEATGIKAGELIKRLMKETNQLYGNNSPIDFDTAALIAVENNIELVVKRQKTAEDILLEEFEQMMENVDPEKLQPRPPVVTIMGHVDHGKTSLLDKIRKSNVAAGEVGGITQVIRAWSVTHKVMNPDDPNEELLEKKITFLDTPGHEAFTKMRARGANVTDIAVIVVAATDGVMPQTEEAVNHAKAAEVRIIVAINKVDAPNANVERTKRQLYNLNLLPDNMGGDIQFVETSALTGQGIDDLLTAISLEAEFNLADDLKADPDRPAFGTCLEGYMSADEGVNATLLVQQGTLRPGDIVLCGANYGRVRTMYDDHGEALEEAGPSTPVRITGLGGVPNADDPFYAVDELTTAAKIAEARETKDREASLNRFQAVKDIGALTAAKSKQKVTELKIILKAEARGSVEAIKKELEKLTHEEVTTRVLHAGIGAISESDVRLAQISPDDTLVIGFNVTADDAALRLAEEQGVSLREYQIIYNLVDDVKAAMEGRLKPIEEVVHLGRAVVRQTFKHGKVGTIAGCYVTSGVLERSARVRVIRGGVVVFPQGDKIVGLDSLKRFKDDAKEVREGFECGLKITGFDDIRIDDVIEAFKIEIRARTL